jgi:pimeloyl-ACP methyl ester carboxylesterase
VSTGVLAGCANNTAGTAASSGASSPMASASALQLTDAELVPLRLFAWDGFNGEALFALGAASSQTSEVGEMLRIVQTINARTGNPAEPTVGAFDAYCASFGEYGDRLAQLASQSNLHPVTARTRYLRASTYATQELFFILGSGQGSREEEVFDKVESRWAEAVKRMRPAGVPFQVDSKFGPLPGWFFAPDDTTDPKPTVIICSGSDGQNVESMQFGVTAGLQRGYNIVLFEGPGQMTPLFKNSVVFTPDWDQVVGPVLEWTTARKDVDKVGLVGVSFGGMLCARAAARLKGLSAVVLEPAAWSFANLWHDQKSVGVVKSTSALPPADKAKAAAELNSGFANEWASQPRSLQFTIYKRGSILSKQLQSDARANVAPSDYYGMLEALLTFNYQQDYAAITIPTMLTQNEGDQFFLNQPAEAFAMLKSVPADQKVLLPLTVPQGAQLHDQPNGPQVAQEFIFDWLDTYLR